MAMPVPEEQQCGTPLPPAAVNLLEGLGGGIGKCQIYKEICLEPSSLVAMVGPKQSWGCEQQVIETQRSCP